MTLLDKNQGDPLEVVTFQWEQTFQTADQGLQAVVAQALLNLQREREAREIVLGRFRDDIFNVLRLYQDLNSGHYEKINFDLGALFGESVTQEEIKAYLSGFSEPMIKQSGSEWSPSVQNYPFPPIAFPITCNIRGEGRTLASHVSGYGPPQQDMPSSLVGFTAMGNIPMLVDLKGYQMSMDPSKISIESTPQLYSFAPELQGKLLESDGQGALATLAVYRDVARELAREQGAHFKTPIISRVLAILPTALDGTYTTEFAPQVYFRDDDKNAGRIFSPFAMVGGARNDCSNFVSTEYSTSGRVLLRSKEGKEALWRATPLTSTNQHFVQREVEESFPFASSTSLVNHAGIILFPYVEKPKAKPVSDTPPQIAHHFSSGNQQFLGINKTLLRTKSTPSVHEAAVTPGTAGWTTAQRKYHTFSTSRVPEYGGQPYIILVRFLTASFGTEKS